MLVLEPSIDITLRRMGLLLPGWPEPRLADLDDAPAEPARDLPASEEAPTFGSVVDVWRRRCGIPRPSSAARSCVAAATVARALVQAQGWDPARLAVVTASTSSATATAASFELRGLTESWSAVDPLLLPSTLLSALATQVAMAVGARGFAQSFVIGLLGVFHAVEAAVHGLARGDADVVLLAAAEEQTYCQTTAHEALGWTPTPGECAGALALERGAGSGYRLAFVAYDEGAAGPVPPGWEDAPRFVHQAPFAAPSLQGRDLMTLLWRALHARPRRAIVTGSVAGLGSASLGFELAAKGAPR